MARLPFGSELVENSVSIAPGFKLDNVIVMAGVPHIMHVMLEAATKFLKTGKKMLSVGIDLHRPEGEIAAMFEAHQKRYPEVPMGSYPFHSRWQAGHAAGAALDRRDAARAGRVRAQDATRRARLAVTPIKQATVSSRCVSSGCIARQVADGWIPGTRLGMAALGVRLVACLLAIVMLAMAHTSALAVEPGEKLADPALEARARRISQELRCLVCQNQSIDDSNAELARDLRLIVRERISAGDSDAQVLAFVEQRYGEFALLRPPFKLHTLALWLMPLLLLIGTLLVLRRNARMRAAVERRDNAGPLSADEQKRLDELLGKKP
jgi:cytochrome c-type biogenesis protein CcmH